MDITTAHKHGNGLHVYIPRNVARALLIRPADQLAWHLTTDGTVILRNINAGHIPPRPGDPHP